MQAHSIPHIAEVHVVRGAASLAAAPPDLLVEVPHGATATADFEELASQLEGPHPPGLVDFFHVNTDIGAFELGLAAAQRLVERAPSRAVALVRSRIPRTFIDCNRRIEASAAEFKAGGVTPGVMPWVASDADLALVRARYDAYQGVVRSAAAGLAPGAAVLLLHSYAPQEVGVEVGPDIVEQLRWAYSPEIAPRWPVRPELDLICRDASGQSHAPAGPLAALKAGVEPWGWTVGESATYPLHPSALAWDHVMARPGLALCLEVRRDLLAEPFDPFAEMVIGEAKVAALAEVVAEALMGWGVA